MIEYGFRITEEQLQRIHDCFTSEPLSQAVILKCGSGETNWGENQTRKTWCVSDILLVITDVSQPLSEEIKQHNICIFLRNGDISNIPQVHQKQDLLYALELDDIVNVYHIVNKQPILMDSVCIIGHNIQFHFPSKNMIQGENQFYKRSGQVFGSKTIDCLSQLTVCVAGVSGTGSIVAEQLARLGVKRLVLVDDDVVEECNLGRILNSSKSDAVNAIKKVFVIEKSYREKELPTKVIPIPTTILNPKTVKLISQCDIIFGCLDSADGRSQLNRVSTFYCIPYFDLGVGLTADGLGGVTEITGSVRYVMPGGSSLVSRGALSQEQIKSDGLRREDPEEYKRRLHEKYIIGATESSPAVISVNMMTASYGVLDMLARLHLYRTENNSAYETISIDMVSLHFWQSEPSTPDEALLQCLGCGDREPLLDMPHLG